MDSSRAICRYLLGLFFLFSCTQKHPPPKVSRAYYYWRTDNMTTGEESFLKQQGVRKLYTHLMDVDWSDVYGPIPVAGHDLNFINSMVNSDSTPVEIIPVIFLTNKTFERIDSFDIPVLAKRLVRRCLPAYDSVDEAYEHRNYNFLFDRPVRPKEIQFDCDWTQKTASYYFSFLREVKRLLPSDSIRISATVRLHQYKYFNRTGVPPVDRGMLMLYNLSNPKRYGPTNSIFDRQHAAEYFTSERPYPLPLDIALPAWSWCIVYRNHEFYQVENGLDEKELAQASFLKPGANHFYRVTQDTVFRDLYLRPGDEIKAEGIDEQALNDAVKLAQKAVNTDSFSVALFELSEKEFHHYSHESLTKVYTSFR